MSNSASNTIRDLLRNFVDAPTWMASLRIVTEHQALLLTDAADIDFVTWIDEGVADDDVASTQTLAWYRDVLQRCRIRGIDATFDNLPEPRPINKALRAFINFDGTEAIFIFVQNFPEAISSSAVQELQELIVQLQASTPERAKKLLDYLISIEMIKLTRDSVSIDLVQLLLDWISLDSWNQSQAMLVENKTRLLSEEAITVLDSLVLRSSGEDASVSEILLQHRAILKTSLRKSIDAAYAELFSPLPLKHALNIVPHDLYDAIQAMIAAKKPAELIEQTRQYPVLLTSRATNIIELLLDELRLTDQEKLLQSIEERYRTLQKIKDENITYTQVSNNLLNLLTHWINARTWNESQTLLMANAERLLSDEALKVLDVLIESESKNEDVVKILLQHRTILENTRSESIATAYADILEPPSKMLDLLKKWIATETWSESETMLRANAEYLLTADAFTILDELLLLHADSDKGVIQTLQNHRNILEIASVESIEAAYAKLLMPSLLTRHLQGLSDELSNAIRAMIKVNNAQELLDQVVLHPILLEPLGKTAIENLLTELRQAGQIDIVHHIEGRFEDLKNFKITPLASISNELVKIITDWITSEDWQQSKGKLEANTKLLLSDEAIEVLNIFLFQAKGNEGATQDFLWLRTILETARNESIDTAYAYLWRRPSFEQILQAFPGNLTNPLFALMNLLGEDYDLDKFRELFTEYPILYAPEIVDMIEQSLNELRLASQGKVVNNYRRMIENLRELITKMQDLKRAEDAQLYHQELVKVLVQTRNPHELQSVITNYPGLCDDEALNVLIKMAEDVEKDGNIVIAQSLRLRLEEVRRIRQQSEQRFVDNNKGEANRGKQITLYAEQGGIAIDTMVGDIYQFENYTASKKNWQLPRRQLLPKTFIGRREELKALCEYLIVGENISISGKTLAAMLQGMGGIGKTYLALKLVIETQDYFPGGVIRVNLGPQITDEDSAQFVLRELASYAFDGIPPVGRLNPEQVAAWLEEMAPGRLLVLFDDVWHQVPLHFLNRALPASAVRLVTTRYANIAQTLGGKSIILGRLTSEDGLALLEDRLNCQDNVVYRPALEELVRLLDGHALALDIVAGLIKFPSRLPRILKDLRQSSGQELLDRLKLPPSEDRDENLEKSLALSYERMTNDQKRYFRMLGVFAPEAPITLDDAAAIWGINDLRVVQSILFDFADLALLTEMTEATDIYYYQHGLLHVYARALLDQANELKSNCWTHADYCRKLAVDSDFPSLDKKQYVQNLLAALEWAENNEPVLFLDLLDVVVTFLIRRGQDSYLEKYLPRAVAVAATLGSKKIQAEFLMNWGQWESERGKTDQAYAHYNAALALFHSENELLSEGQVLRLLGDREMQQDNFEQARMHFSAALALFGTEYNQTNSYAFLLKSFGDLELRQGNLESARMHYETALPLFRTHQNKWGEAHVLRSLGDLERVSDQYEQARSFFEESLSIYCSLGSRIGQANSHFGLGRLEMELNNLDETRTHFITALSLFQADHIRSGQAAIYEELGSLYERIGENIEQVISYYEAALEIYREEHKRFREASLMDKIGDLQRRLGNLSQARSQYINALMLFRSLGDRPSEAMVLESLGILERRLNNLEQARVNFNEALSLSRALGHQARMASVLVSLGELEFRLNNLDQTRAYFEEALPLFQTVHFASREAALYEGLGRLEMGQGKYEQARNCYDKALELFRSEQRRLGEANVLRHLGNLEFHLGNLDQARSVYNAALSLYNLLYNKFGKANILVELGDVERHSGNLDLAYSFYSEAIPIYEVVSSQLEKGNALQKLGELSSIKKEWIEARNYFDQALSLFIAEQNMQEQATVLIDRGRVGFASGEHDQGTKDFEQAIALLRSVQNEAGACQAELDLTRAYMRVEQIESGLTALDALLELARADLSQRSQLVSRRKELLLSEHIEQVFALLLNAHHANANFTKVFEHLRINLQRCRQWGVDSAFFLEERMFLGNGVNIPIEHEASVMQISSLLIQAEDDHAIRVQAIERMKILLSHLPDNKEDLFRGALLRDLAETMRSLPVNHPIRDLDQIAVYYREAVSYYQASRRHISVAYILLNLANLYCISEDWEQAKYSLEQALPLFAAENDISGNANALILLGCVRFEVGDHEQGMQDVQYAAELFYAKQDETGVNRAEFYLDRMRIRLT